MSAGDEAALEKTYNKSRKKFKFNSTLVYATYAWMLLKKPGCYIWIGNGDGAGSCMVHNPGYDFNDDILPIGASYWATLVEQQLARQAIPQAAE